MLETPTDQDLGGRPAVLRSNGLDDRVVESMSAGERTVRLELDAVALAEREQIGLV